ncbi:MAG: c-type cytochrome [Bacteroidetes bacterium]|nr:c-type cytochrome [Bacteroidota bacterium]
MKVKISKSRKKSTIAILAIGLIFLVSTLTAQDGEQLFQQCKACHTIGQGKLLGPDLLDVSKRRDAAWVKNFIKSSQTMVKIGDADAVALFEEFNKLPMLDYKLPDTDIDAIIKYIDSFSTPDSGDNGTKSAADSLADVKAAEYLASIDTDENEAKGKALFQGNRKFKNGGAACISCHHVNTSDAVQGGLLAMDLTNTFSRIGGMAGIKGILGFPPYPAMRDAYQHAALTDDESVQLQVFLMRADKKGGGVAENTVSKLMKQGIIGVLVLLVIISLVWFKRKKRSVNYQIIKRQRRYS